MSDLDDSMFDFGPNARPEDLQYLLWKDVVGYAGMGVVTAAVFALDGGVRLAESVFPERPRSLQDSEQISFKEVAFAVSIGAGILATEALSAGRDRVVSAAENVGKKLLARADIFFKVRSHTRDD